MRVRHASILTIGDELLRGEIVDSNKAVLAERLLRVDIEARWQLSVRDRAEEIDEAIRLAAARSDLVLISGGLGPTRDDITVRVLAETLGRKLVLDRQALETIRAFFARLGREMADTNEKQAYFPEGAEVLPNPVGTAPGCWIEEGNTIYVCLPGVPRELIRMMDEQVLPRLAERQGDRRRVVKAALLRTFGIGESDLEAVLRDVARGPDVELGFRTAFPDNLLRPLVRAASETEAMARLKSLCAEIRARLGELVYSESERETLEVVVVKRLRERALTVAAAESCTGGLLAERLTSVAGASECFRGGVVAYANAAKRDLLGVDESLLAAHGAVSPEVAEAMATGARERFAADLAIGITGISGPGGGTPEKPVGLVYLALAAPEGTRVERFRIALDRARHRLLTTQIALDWLRRRALGLELRLPRFGRRGEAQE